MGYSTSYELTAFGVERDEATTELEDIVGNDPLSDSCKWYEHDEDMLKLAKRFPDAVFMLSGEGEEAGDVWRAYYKHGEPVAVCQAELRFPEPPAWALAAGAQR